MDNEKRCLWTKKGLKCFTSIDGGSAFKESRNFFVKSVERMDKDTPFRIVKNCKVQGVDCFNRNIKNAGFFFFMLLMAGFLLNFLHELVHFSLLFFIGEYDAKFTFSANSGFTVGDVPPFGDPSVPWYWWFCESMGPLVIVNFTFVLITMSLVNHDARNPPFIDKKIAMGISWTKNTFLKAIAYTSAFTILTNTIFSPFYNLFYAIMGAPYKKSDFSVAWEASLYLAEPFGTITRFMIIGAVAMIISVTIIYIFLYNRRETGE